MNRLEWYFPSTDGGEVSGINDPVMNQFQGHPEYFIAREGIQNALDARFDYEHPVVVQFEVFTVKTLDIPELEAYESSLRAAERFTRSEGKARRFFASAKEVLDEGTIQVFRIGDYNTTGLTGGQDDPTGSWFRLVRAVGSNSQTGVGGGSHGLGKGAPFAASALRMVFYSSVDKSGSARFQGKVRLASFIDEKDGDIKRNVGDLGVKRVNGRGVTAAEKEALIPPAFRRTKVGTDVFVVGVKAEAQDWVSAIRSAVTENFWAAIHFGDLEVQFINQGNLVDEITSETLSRHFDEDGADSRSRDYYDAVTKPSAEFHSTLTTVGDVSLYVRLGPGLPQRVQMMRKSRMKVWNRRFAVLATPFCGVFMCHSDHGNSILRELEPAKHDKWDAGLYPGEGRRALGEIVNWVGQNLGELRDSLNSPPEDLPGLEDLLPISDKRDRHDLPNGDEIDDEDIEAEESAYESGADDRFKLTSSTKTKRPVKMKPGKQPGRGPGGRRGQGGAGKKRSRTASGGSGDAVFAFRCIEDASLGEGTYRAYISADTDMSGTLKIRAVGEEVTETMKIASVLDETGSAMPVNDIGVPNFSLNAGESKQIIIKLESPRRYLLEALI